jgi:cobalamin biosynthesis protein CbiD
MESCSQIHQEIGVRMMMMMKKLQPGPAAAAAAAAAAEWERLVGSHFHHPVVIPGPYLKQQFYREN